ncbi:SDR family oxidoreductase [Micromonospora zamorensis]|uniref:SDR family oxidoreductase n=1 Tax=Micromonospora zamorensis TaxID=709883 RepID=A0ABZ1PJL9_9ACTN
MGCSSRATGTRQAAFLRTQDLFEAYFRVIMRGPYFLTQTFLPLIADNGAIVTTTSNSALPTGLTAGNSVYASVKGGLITMTRYLAKELAPCGSR